MLCTRNWTDEELKVAQEWIKRDSRNLPLGRHCICPDSCYRRSNILAFYLCFSFFGLIVFGFGIYVGYVFVRPYRLSLGFKNATCITSQAVVDPSAPWQECSCGWWCQSEYPCLRVYVNVSLPDKPDGSDDDHDDITSDVTTMLHDNEMYMDGPCTFEPRCAREREENRLAVEEYQEKVGTPGELFFCLYDPYDVQRVITVQRSDPWWVIHLLLWPNVVALVFFASVFVTCLTCGHRYVCAASPPSEISQEASHRVGDSLEHMTQRLEEGRPLRKATDKEYSTINPEPC